MRRDKLCEGDDDDTPLPSFQELQRDKPDWLVRHSCDLGGAIKGEYREKFAVVTHRWEEKHQPDPTGKQKRQIRAMLREKPNIEYVWMVSSRCWHYILKKDASQL